MRFPFGSTGALTPPTDSATSATVAPQPQSSSAGHVAIGYYDQMVAVLPDKGSYVVVNVPFVVVEGL